MPPGASVSREPHPLIPALSSRGGEGGRRAGEGDSVRGMVPMHDTGIVAALHGLPRSRRIRAGRDFDRARTQGRRLVQGCLVLNWIPLPPEAVSRLGVITSRKLGNAVARSRARRLLRECFRRHQQAFAGPLDVVLVARQSILGRKLGEVEKDYLQALGKARLFKDSRAAGSPPAT